MSFEENDLAELGRVSPAESAASELEDSNSVVDTSSFRHRMNLLSERVGGPQELATRSGLSRRVIDNYRAGGSDPSRSRLVRLARAGGVTLEWLATGEGEIEPRPGAVPITAHGLQIESTAADAGRYVQVPRYDVRASAGPGALVDAESVIEQVLFDREYLRLKLRLNPRDLALIEAHGDSMAETIQSGDLMLVDTSSPRLRGDGIYVIAIDDTLLVKRIEVRLDGGLLLKSDNTRYSPIEVPRRDLTTLRIVGRVVWVGGEV